MSESLGYPSSLVTIYKSISGNYSGAVGLDGALDAEQINQVAVAGSIAELKYLAGEAGFRSGFNAQQIASYASAFLDLGGKLPRPYFQFPVGDSSISISPNNWSSDYAQTRKLARELIESTVKHIEHCWRRIEAVAKAIERGVSNGSNSLGGYPNTSLVFSEL